MRLGVGRPVAVRPAAQPPRHEEVPTASDTPPLAPGRCSCRVAARTFRSAAAPGGQPLPSPATAISARVCRESRMNWRSSKPWSRSCANLSVAHDLASMAFPNRRPIRAGRTSSGFGTRRDPFTGRLARHEGLDFPAPAGTPILASAGGWVVTAGASGAYGNAVVIDHGNGSRPHRRRFPGLRPSGRPRDAAAGDSRRSSSTGRSTGAHLHFEVMRHGIRVQPRDYLAQVDAPIGLP